MDYFELAKEIVCPSRTERCRFCKELHNVLEFPELNGVCQDCWHKIQDYLTERGFSII